MNQLKNKLKTVISILVDNRKLNTKKNLLKIVKFIFPLRTFKEKKLLLRYKNYLKDVDPIFREDLGLNCKKIDTDSIVLSSRERFDQKKYTQKNRKEYLQELTNIFDYPPNSPEIMFASSKVLLKSIISYLGCFPVLHNITLMYSPNKVTNSLSGSQLWHRDAEDIKNIKIWIPINEIDEDCGPTLTIDKDKSNEIAKKLNYIQGGLVEENHEDFSKIKPIKLVGKAGDVIITDTDSSFHCGSVPKNNKSKQRLVLMIHYVSGFSSYYRPVINLKPNNYNKIYNFEIRDPITKDLLRFII